MWSSGGSAFWRVHLMLYPTGTSPGLKNLILSLLARKLSIMVDQEGSSLGRCQWNVWGIRVALYCPGNQSTRGSRGCLGAHVCRRGRTALLVRKDLRAGFVCLRGSRPSPSLVVWKGRELANMSNIWERNWTRIYLLDMLRSFLILPFIFMKLKCSHPIHSFQTPDDRGSAQSWYFRGKPRTLVLHIWPGCFAAT